MPLTPAQIEQLIAASRNVRLHSYSPYSEFGVGAAVLTKDGDVFAGTNVENSSYGLTICAERSAIYSAVAAGERTIEAIAISLSGEPIPCGACLQVMAEFNPQMTVLLDNVDTSLEDVQIMSLDTLLPRPFSLNPDA